MAAAASISAVQNFIATQYQAKDFPGVRKNRKHQVLHYLLALNQPDQSILDWIKTCDATAKYTGYINLKDTRELPPVSLAILLGRRKIVRALCEHPKIDMEAKDRAGWIPLQHAIARGDREILEIVENGTDAHRKTAGKVDRAAKERFPFLRDVVREVQIQLDDAAVPFRTPTGRTKILSQSEFAELNQGVLFSDRLSGLPDSIFLNWCKQVDLSNDLMPIMEKKFHEYMKKKPKLILTQEQNSVLGVRTENKIKKGQIATFWGSELTPPHEVEENSSITTNKRFSNFGAIARDGFPNVHEYRTIIDGVEFASHVALCDIETGSELFQGYDISHPCKWGPRLEPTLDELKKAFPQRLSPSRVWRNLRRNEADAFNPDMEIDRQGKMAGLTYLFHTPSVLLSLVLQNYFDADSISRLLDDQNFLEEIDFAKKSGMKFVEFYREALLAIEEISQKANPDLVHHIAGRLGTNVRAGYIALQMLNELQSPTTQEFDRFYLGTEAFFALLEERGEQEISLQHIRALSSDEKQSIIRFAEAAHISKFVRS